MNIVYNCNERFAVHTAVSIASLFDSNRAEEKIRVFILGNGLSTESVKGFGELAESFGREIAITDLRDYEAALRLLFGRELNTGGFDVTVLARLFAASHLPDEVEKYLYLDADTVVLSSLKELYDTELPQCGCICAMVPEPTIYEETRQEIGLEDDMPYYNSGMLLVDRRAWEEESITGACIDYYKSLGGKGLMFPDQDIINHVLTGKIKTVWQGYNFFSNYCYQSYESLCRRAAWFSAVMSREEYERAAGEPAVVHFAGAERPWIRGSRNPYRAEYYRFRSMTPWAETPPEKGQEIKMLAYHMMNVVTRYCPGAREIISGLYFRSRK
ncbi:MAG: glycosyltransferase family 8 protein [Clostridiales bacterium]|nr:glycosyltransferase family 8 protein [Clostridiales bacterium]